MCTDLCPAWLQQKSSYKGREGEVYLFSVLNHLRSFSPILISTHLCLFHPFSCSCSLSPLPLLAALLQTGAVSKFAICRAQWCPLSAVGRRSKDLWCLSCRLNSPASCRSHYYFCILKQRWNSDVFGGDCRAILGFTPIPSGAEHPFLKALEKCWECDRVPPKSSK